MKAINESEARVQIINVLTDAIAGLPTKNAKWHSDAITRFLNDSGPMSSLYLEFESSFHVSASLNVTCQSGRYDGEVEFVVSVSTSSGQRTLAQAQAAHNLMGRTLEAAHAVQAAIDSIGTIVRAGYTKK